jgi:hypothetical protein
MTTTVPVSAAGRRLAEPLAQVNRDVPRPIMRLPRRATTTDVTESPPSGQESTEELR